LIIFIKKILNLKNYFFKNIYRLMSNIYVSYLENLVKSKYSSSALKNFDIKLEKNAVQKFHDFLSSLQPLPLKNEKDLLLTRTDKRVQDFIPNIAVSNILEIGAGKEANIILGLGKELNLPPSKIFALDPKLKEKEGLVCLQYAGAAGDSGGGKIPLPDKSIDLIILSMVLHHIEPIDRILLVSELKRIITANGVIQVREHALPNDESKSAEFTLFIELVHEFWYVYNKEDKDELYLMTLDECKELFSEFKIIKEDIDENNVQNVVNFTFSLTSDPAKTDFTGRKLEKYNEMTHNFKTIESIFLNRGGIPEELKMKINEKDDLYSDFEWFQLMRQISGYLS
jgi:SAM-dependent methyltransferase